MCMHLKLDSIQLQNNSTDFNRIVRFQVHMHTSLLGIVNYIWLPMFNDSLNWNCSHKLKKEPDRITPVVLDWFNAIYIFREHFIPDKIF